MLQHNKKIIKVIYFHILLFILFVSYYIINTYFGFKIFCPFHELTGYLCPGCGITRCLFAILNGNFIQAFYYNRLVFICLPFSIILYLYDMYVEIFNKKKKFIVPNFIYILLLVVVLLFGVFRNIF